MRAATHPRDEERLAHLHAYEILDTDPEQDFSDIVKLASAICGTPASTITFVDRAPAMVQGGDRHAA